MENSQPWLDLGMNEEQYYKMMKQSQINETERLEAAKLGMTREQYNKYKEIISNSVSDKYEYELRDMMHEMSKSVAATQRDPTIHKKKITCEDIRSKITEYININGKKKMIELFKIMINDPVNGLISKEYDTLIELFNSANDISKLITLNNLIDKLCSDVTHGGTDFIKNLDKQLDMEPGQTAAPIPAPRPAPIPAPRPRPAPEPRHNQFENKGEKYKALYDYHADENGELSFKEGEILTLKKNSIISINPNWPEVINENDQNGLVPLNYLQKITSGGSRSKSKKNKSNKSKSKKNHRNHKNKKSSKRK
uniref:SH3 domain-containing protein n=1 Tax=viral metagenome TaxID=1070528 RepID=A0A6C0EZT6_9ZZZZ